MPQICSYEDCKVNASYWFPNEGKLCCAKHKKPGMFCRNDNCMHPGCLKHSNFNYPGQKPQYCKTHKLQGMTDVKTKKCIFNECNKIPVFNYSGHTVGLYCGSHRLPGMKDIKSKICIATDCNLMASFNYPGNPKLLYCSKHSLTGMKCMKGKRCIVEECNKRASFNYLGEKEELYCAHHKQACMIIVKKNCVEEGCAKIASFNYSGQKKRMYCSSHRKEGMVNLAMVKCKSCGLFGANKTTSYLCSYCNPNKSKIQKTKENAVRDLLIKNNITFIQDKTIQNDCCIRSRPDFLIDCSTHFLVLEVDEHAHSGYEKDCEIVRMNNISHSLGLPTKFIRYNPDNKAYTTKHKQSVLIESLQKHMTELDNIEPLYLFY